MITYELIFLNKTKNQSFENYETRGTFVNGGGSTSVRSSDVGHVSHASTVPYDRVVQ